MQVYLLAAGHGRRAGGAKAWIEHDGRPLLERHVTFLARELPDASVAVSMQSAWRARCEALSASAEWVAVDPALTPFGALRALLDVCPLASWSFVYHVDMPLWDPAVFTALADHVPAAEARDADAIVPLHEGRAGHPVLLAPRAAASLLALDPVTGRLDRWLRTRRVDSIAVDTPSVLENWNLKA